MDPLFDVNGKSIVIVGAGGGIGSAVTHLLAERRARLTLCDIDSERLDSTMAQIDGEQIKIIADIRSEHDCTAVMHKAYSNFDSIDVLINAAGVLPIAAADAQDSSSFRNCLESNVTAAYLVSKAAKKIMKPGSAIVHLASVSSLVANTGYSAYATSKAALSQLVRVLAREWAEDEIRINAIGPALIETPLTKDYLAVPEFHTNAVDSIPLGRLATADDLFGTILLLSSSAGSFITGQTIYVDGGRTLV